LFWFVWLAMITLAGCTTYAHQRLLQAGEIESFTIHSGYFQHRLFQATVSETQSPDSRLHIYLGGDGHPWRTPRQVASDPTSKRALMLENMLRDDMATSLYIGRPCYFQTTDSHCRGNWWTHDRYHPNVVNSLMEVIEQQAERYPEVWLIGHSGGGALALLVGRRLNRPVNVVTVNANLDHQAWTDYHQYSPLTGSLNPMFDRAHNPDMQELHWYATDDRAVLSEWILAYCQKNQTPCRSVSGSHSEGWPAQWQTMLRQSREILSRPE
jgi:pimeloyl-ACP methyl ester carboxylesterase